MTWAEVVDAALVESARSRVTAGALAVGSPAVVKWTRDTTELGRVDEPLKAALGERFS